jgi:hypothetical protein
MRKLCFVLTALLLAAPALAAVNISCQQVGYTTEVEISYDSTGSLPRAFALDVTVDTGTITAISDVSSDFWVYPGTIQITGGTISDEGDPVAPNTDPCALGGLGTSGITLEMGSLYSPNDVSHPNAPAASGKLLSITVSAVPCTLTISGNGARGNVVLEDTAAADTNLPVVCVLEPEPDCLKSSAPGYADWVAFGKPDCWCFRRQCRGDATGTKLGYWVQSADLAILKAAWYKSDAVLATVTNGICADFNHAKLGYRVQSADLSILKTYWYKSDALCPQCDANGDGVLEAGDIYNFWTN